MNRLPQELVDLLVTHSASILRQESNPNQEQRPPAPQSLAPFATVSPEFHYAVERLTFREIRLDSPDLNEFEAAITRHEHRGRAFKGVKYHVILPIDAPEPSARCETTWCRQRNCQAGLPAISRLLTFLSTQSAAKPIRLYVRFNETGKEKLQYKAEEQYFYSCLGLSNTEERDKIPAAPCVSHLFLGYEKGGQVTPDAIMGFIEKFTGMKDLSLLLREPDYFGEFRRRVDPLCSAVRSLGEGRKALRYEGMLEPSFFWPFANPEEPVPFWQTIEEMDMQIDMTTPTGCWYFKSPLDNSFGPSNGRPGSHAGMAVDPPGLSSHSALNRLAIEALHVQQQFRSVTRLMATVMWQSHIIHNIGPGQISVDYDADFPFEVDEREMVPLLEAMAKALVQMPHLRSFRLFLDLGMFHPGNDAMTRQRPQLWAINYRGPREKWGKLSYEMPEDGEEELVKVPRFYLHVGGWSPAEDLPDLFREVGRRNHGQEAIIVYHPPRFSGSAGEISAE
ncbi:hypothetical protein CMUS01_03754 [Colletotrichum musicola]|uniref:Uncharacterized protein n=1 Tax=Colletotrichum musicola TaxID=2175873 RepID=A0A8H6U5K3_9PEZI|nr:hypothetical protein CMUS01_03754 [Colletotrichum musicola]